MASLADAALDRLEQHGAQRSRGQPFTCDLSVEELSAIEDSGFAPLRLVMGSCVYQMGWQWVGWTEAKEVDVLSTAMYASRERAVRLMKGEAARAGADGVVGVHIDIDFGRWGEGLAEFTAIGTAVAYRAKPGSFRTPVGEVFTSDLAGQDLWALLRSGHRPLGLVMGCCVYHYPAQGLAKWFSNLRQNAELEGLTAAFYSAREAAMDRMQKEALGLGSLGVVGVNISERSHAWGGHTIEFLALGTAVRSLDQESSSPKPQMVRKLNA